MCLSPWNAKVSPPPHFSLFMEQVQNLDQAMIFDHGYNVETSRPFRSVKEAVDILGERFLIGEVYSPKPFSFPPKETPFFSLGPRVDIEPSSEYSSPSPSSKSSRGSSHSRDAILLDTIKKLETELNETKDELKLLKERESENEVALALLNAELHETMSKLALAEAAVIAKTTINAPRFISIHGHGVMDHRETMKKEDEQGIWLEETESSPSKLAQILRFKEDEGLSHERKEEGKGMKKKPIFPIVGDLFSKKKGPPTALDNPLYGSI